MISATQFAQYLLRLDPHRSVGRLAFYNYLKHIIEPNEAFSPQTVNGFYALALNYDHWQNNALSLGHDVREDLERFLATTKVEQEGWEKIHHADEIQVVNFRHNRDFEEAVRYREESRRKSGDRYKLLRMSETELLSVYLSALGSLEVKVYSPKAMIFGRHLIPLAPMTHLHYTATMELVPQIRQRLQGSLMTTISFAQDEKGLSGMITRGHSFQKFETFFCTKSSDNHDLFSNLKKIERHFINPQSDPYYQELVYALERANRVIHSPNARAVDFQAAERTLQKGHLAVRHAFPNDRLLQLLITHLDYGIRQAHSQTQPPIDDARSPE